MSNNLKNKIEDNKEIQKAMIFMVSALKESKNPKPVILHSTRVFALLDTEEYKKDVLVGALMHDLIEDSDTTKADIEVAFGKEAAELAQANSFNKEIEDETEQYKELFKRCKEKGKDALLIKTADLLDNIGYYGDDGPYEKVNHFITIAEEELKNEPIFNTLKEKYVTLTAENSVLH